VANLLGSILVSLGFNGAGFFEGMTHASVIAKTTGKEIEGAFAGVGGAITTALAPLGPMGAVVGQAFNQMGAAANDALQSITKLAGGGGLGLVAGGAAGLVAAVGAADLAMIGIAIHATENANRLYEMSQKTGIAVETLSAFSEAGEIVGISTEQMSGAIEKMNRSAFAASTAPEGMKNAYTRLGIAVKDSSGNFRATDQILLDVADKFAHMDNGITKTALSMQIFGRSGAALIPFLNRGRDGIGELTTEAEKLGAVLTTSAAASAHQFQEDLKTLGVGVDGVENKLMTELIPTLNVMADAMKGSMEDNASGLNKFISGVGTITKFFLTLGETAWEVLQQIGLGTAEAINIYELFAVAVDKVKTKMEHFDFSGAKDEAKRGMAAIAAEVKTGGEASDKIWNDYAKTIGQIQSPPAPKAEKKESGAGVDTSGRDEVKNQASTAKEILDISEARYKAQAAQAHLYYEQGEIDARQWVDAETTATNLTYQAHVTYFNKLRSIYADDPVKVQGINAEETKFKLDELARSTEGLAQATAKYAETSNRAMSDSSKELLKEQADDMDRLNKATQDYAKSVAAEATAQQGLKAAQGKGTYTEQVEQIKVAMEEGLKSKQVGWTQIAALDKGELDRQLAAYKANGTQLASAQVEAQADLLEAQKAGDQARILEAQAALNAILAAEKKNQTDTISAQTVADKKLIDDQKQADMLMIASQKKVADAVASTAAKSIMSGKNMGAAFQQLSKQMATTALTNFMELETIEGRKKLKDAEGSARGAYAGVMKMNLPPPIAFPLAIGAAAAAFAGIMAFGEGGIVPGVGSSDSVPARLMPGEIILPTDLSKGLQNMATNSRFSGSAQPTFNSSAGIHPAIASQALSQSQGRSGHTFVNSPTVHAVDSEGVDRMLTKHNAVFQRHLTSTLRKMNK
jgi:hypothetical protein